MLKYLYSNNHNKAQITNVITQKIINDNYTNKFYIRSSISELETKNILILDNNYNFFLINKKNIQKHLLLFKEKNLLGKSLQLKEFLYFKKKYFKMSFFIKKKNYNSSLSYLKTLFLLKKRAINSININWILLIINRGNFMYLFNGLKGFLPKKRFNKLKKLLKKFKKFIFLKQKFNFVLKKQKKMIIKSLLLKNLKSNKIFITKNKYKNQLLKLAPFPKPRKTFIKNIK
jgi:hypothetical protein